MNPKIQKTILAGLIGTAVMTLIMILAPMMGMPKMSAPGMLSGMLGTPLFVGWLMHFMIGIMFAFAYSYAILCLFNHKIQNIYLKGAVFGLMVFVVAQIMMAIMGAMMPMPEMAGSKALMMLGSLMGHIFYGIAVAKTVGEEACEVKPDGSQAK